MAQDRAPDHRVGDPHMRVEARHHAVLEEHLLAVVGSHQTPVTAVHDVHGLVNVMEPASDRSAAVDLIRAHRHHLAGDLALGPIGEVRRQKHVFHRDVHGVADGKKAAVRRAVISFASDQVRHIPHRHARAGDQEAPRVVPVNRFVPVGDRLENAAADGDRRILRALCQGAGHVRVIPVDPGPDPSVGVHQQHVGGIHPGVLIQTFADEDLFLIRPDPEPDLSLVREIHVRIVPHKRRDLRFEGLLFREHLEDVLREILRRPVVDDEAGRAEIHVGHDLHREIVPAEVIDRAVLRADRDLQPVRLLMAAGDRPEIVPEAVARGSELLIAQKTVKHRNPSFSSFLPMIASPAFPVKEKAKAPRKPGFLFLFRLIFGPGCSTIEAGGPGRVDS